MYTKSRTLYLLVAILTLVMGCNKEELSDQPAESDPCTSTISKESVTAAYAGSIDFRIEVLRDFVASFISHWKEATGNSGMQADELTDFRRRFKHLHKRWAARELFAYNPDGSSTTIDHINAFPVDTNLVLSYLTTLPESLPPVPNFDRGLPALEFLLFRLPLEEVHKEMQENPNYVALVELYLLEIDKHLASHAERWLAIEDTFAANGSIDGRSAFDITIKILGKHHKRCTFDRFLIPLDHLGPNKPDLSVAETRFNDQVLENLLEASSMNNAFTLSSKLTYYLAYVGNEGAFNLAREMEELSNQIDDNLRDILEVPLPEAAEQHTTKIVRLRNQFRRQNEIFSTELPAMLCL